MALLSFKERFSHKVRVGRKLQTIRTERKFPIKKNERLYLYFGARTKWCKKLAEGICTSYSTIIVNENSVTIHGLIDTHLTSQSDLEDFAKKDGFCSWRQMRMWWKLTHGPDCFPFEGVLIKWTFVKKKDWFKPGTNEKFKKR